MLSTSHCFCLEVARQCLYGYEVGSQVLASQLFVGRQDDQP